MATTLADLSADAIGLIFDLLSDSKWLVPALLVGNTALNNKIFGKVSRFSVTYSYNARHARWPKILASFLALEHVSICANDPAANVSPACVYGVELLALPPTLRKLELNFCGDLLCLIDLPPLSYIEGKSFTPRLRSDLRDRFKNLETLTFGHSIPDWDLSRLAEDFASWPLSMEYWPHFLPTIPLSRVSSLPDGVLNLSIHISADPSQQDEASRLPPSLLTLRLSKDVPREFATSNHRYFQKHELVPLLSQPKHLTSLRFVTKTIDTELLLLLPHTLLSLSIISMEAELESFAHFPPELTSLIARFDTVFSSRTGHRQGSSFDDYDGDGLPYEFLPSMREDVVAKLPKRLERIPGCIWILIRPKDWDAVPSRQARTGPDYPIALANHHTPYLQHLPLNTEHITLYSEVTSLALISALPSTLVEVHLSLCVVLDGGASVHPEIELKTVNDAVRHFTSLLEALSRCSPLLRFLYLAIDPWFDLALLHHLRAPNLMELHFDTDDISPDDLADPLRPRPPAESPQCLSSLRLLRIDKDAWIILQEAMPCILKGCTSLKELFLPSEPPAFPSRWLSMLPPTLEYFCGVIDQLDSETFQAFPKSIQEMILYSIGRTDYDLPDLLFLPRGLRSISMAPPKGRHLPSGSTLDILRERIRRGRRHFAG